jgi:DNA-binding transcriptional regulator YdaS (Cro superfamily)
MELKTYLTPMTPDEREVLAGKCGTTRGHLQNVMYGQRACAPELAVSIEQQTEGKVTRQELRSDWKAIWPELAEA